MRIVVFYEQTEGATYRSTAEHFRVGEATVNRVLRAVRETGCVMPVTRPKPPKNKIDLTWLRQHALAEPNARLKDYAACFAKQTGIVVSVSSVQRAMAAIGITKKKSNLRQGARHRTGALASRSVHQ
jgi:transposase